MRIRARELLEQHAADHEPARPSFPVVTPATWAKRDCSCGVCDACRHWVRMAADQNAQAWRDSSMPGTRRDEPFSSTAHAVASMYSSDIDGAPVLGLSDPSRLAAIVDGRRGGSAVDANPGPAARQAELLVTVRRAYRVALESAGTERLGGRDLEAAMMARWVRGLTPQEIAEGLAERGSAATHRDVSRATRRAHQRLYEELRERGMVPKAEWEGWEEMATFEERDLQGWGEIATYIGASITTAQRYARDGMPVYRWGKRVSASRSEVGAWIDSQTIGPDTAQGGAR